MELVSDLAAFISHRERVFQAMFQYFQPYNFFFSFFLFL